MAGNLSKRSAGAGDELLCVLEIAMEMCGIRDLTRLRCASRSICSLARQEISRVSRLHAYPPGLIEGCPLPGAQQLALIEDEQRRDGTPFAIVIEGQPSGESHADYMGTYTLVPGCVSNERCVWQAVDDGDLFMYHSGGHARHLLLDGGEDNVLSDDSVWCIGHGDSMRTGAGFAYAPCAVQSAAQTPDQIIFAEDPAETVWQILTLVHSAESGGFTSMQERSYPVSMRYAPAVWVHRLVHPASDEDARTRHKCTHLHQHVPLVEKILRAHDEAAWPRLMFVLLRAEHVLRAVRSASGGLSKALIKYQTAIVAEIEATIGTAVAAAVARRLLQAQFVSAK